MFSHNFNDVKIESFLQICLFDWFLNILVSSQAMSRRRAPRLTPDNLSLPAVTQRKSGETMTSSVSVGHIILTLTLGAQNRDRTHDFLIRSRALYRLNYLQKKGYCVMKWKKRLTLGRPVTFESQHLTSNLQELSKQIL